MQFSLFFIGTTFLFISSQIGFISTDKACCPCGSGWTKFQEYCYKIYETDKPISSRDEWMDLCVARNAASDLKTFTPGPDEKYLLIWLKKTNVTESPYLGKTRYYCRRTLYDVSNGSKGYG